MLHHHKSSKIIDKWAMVSICMLNNQRVMPSIIILFGSVPRWDRYDFSLLRRNFRICKMPYPWNKTVLPCNRLYSDIVWLKQIFKKKFPCQTMRKSAYHASRWTFIVALPFVEPSIGSVQRRFIRSFRSTARINLEHGESAMKMFLQSDLLPAHKFDIFVACHLKPLGVGVGWGGVGHVSVRLHLRHEVDATSRMGLGLGGVGWGMSTFVCTCIMKLMLRHAWGLGWVGWGMSTFVCTCVMKLMLRHAWGWGWVGWGGACQRSFALASWSWCYVTHGVGVGWGRVGHVNVRLHLRHEVDATSRMGLGLGGVGWAMLTFACTTDT